jgi:hypothetical protein
MKPKWKIAYDEWSNSYYAPRWFSKYIDWVGGLDYVFNSSGRRDENEKLYLRELFCKEYFKE